MRKLIIILIFIAAQNIFGQSGWQWVNPLPSGNDLKVQFFNSKTGFGIGNCGTVVKTTNGGNNWFSVTSCGGSAFNLLDLCIINSDTVYITGYNDISWYPACLFKSTDSGKSWSIITNNLPFVYSGHTIFNDVNTGYIINGGNIYKTTNGGQNWVTKLSTSFTGKQIIFMNNQIGFASFNAYNPYRRMILKTSDSGANWDSVFVENSSAYINAMSFINISTGYVVAYPKLLKTTNSGISWDSIAPSPQVFSSMSFINNETGYTTGSNVILKTTNMGITWNAKSVIGNLSYISVPSSDTCFASGEGGAIYRTTNAGVNWNCTSTQNPELKVLKDIYFINEQTGFICGYNGAFLKSTNGGVNWQVSKINNKDFFSVYFIDALTGFLGYQTVTSSSYLYRTTNSGQSWDSTSVLGSVFDFYFLNNSTGFYSNAERVYKTTNSGLNWSPTQYTGGGSSMLSGSIQFLNQTTGYFFKMN